MSLWIVIPLTVLATLLASLIISQFLPREKKLKRTIEHAYGVEDAQFTRTLDRLLRGAVLEGNKIEMLENGEEIFPAMLEAIRSARETITFETFIYWSGDIGRQFADALIERCDEGVKVHVALDWFGSKNMDRAVLRRLEECRIELARYHPPAPARIHLFNRRTHRKLLIVDGCLGFTGGVGIADEWKGDGTRPEQWRDSHFRIQGPVVHQLQAAFMDNWLKTNSVVLHDERYFPELAEAGESTAQVFQSSSDEGGDSMRLMFLLAITAAERSIRISSAYFVPDDLSIETLIGARKRGVDIEIIVPGGEIDYQVVRRASRARWGALLKAGVRIFEYQPTMYHRKLMVIDGLWSTVGSTNFDNRSFRLNDEVNLNARCREFAAKLLDSFERDKDHCREVTYESWLSRPLKEKMMERLAVLLRSQL